ncbi:MAG: protoporphyrinogen oxidase HemJ [Pseudomonadota bacterium]
MYLWLKAFHLIFVISWFAGLLYLPRLFVYHSMTEEATGRERFQVMERKLFALMTIAAIGAAVFGVAMIVVASNLLAQPWLHAKLVLVAALIAYHIFCLRIMADFREGRETHSHVWFRWFNEAPALILIAVVLLVVLKPF